MLTSQNVSIIIESGHYWCPSQKYTPQIHPPQHPPFKSLTDFLICCVPVQKQKTVFQSLADEVFYALKIFMITLSSVYYFAVAIHWCYCSFVIFQLSLLLKIYSQKQNKKIKEQLLIALAIENNCAFFKQQSAKFH